MATARLTVVERDSILNEVKAILQRPREAFPCPVPISAFVALHEAQFAPGVAAAYRLLRIGAHIPLASLYNSDMQIQLVGKERLSMHAYEPNAFAYSRAPEHNALAPNVSAMTPMKAAQIVGDQLVADIVRWYHEVRSYEEAGQQAYDCIDDVLGLANTVGQVVRMIPEIVSFLSPAKQAVCLEQQKASAPPPEWAAFPRDRVHAALDHIAKCGLLPKVEYRTYGLGILKYLAHLSTYPLLPKYREQTE